MTAGELDILEYVILYLSCLCFRLSDYTTRNTCLCKIWPKLILKMYLLLQHLKFKELNYLCSSENSPNSTHAVCLCFLTHCTTERKRKHHILWNIQMLQMSPKNASILSLCYLSWKEEDVETINCLNINPFLTIHKTMENVFISIWLTYWQ